MDARLYVWYARGRRCMPQVRVRVIQLPTENIKEHTLPNLAIHNIWTLDLVLSFYDLPNSLPKSVSEYSHVLGCLKTSLRSTITCTGVLQVQPHTAGMQPDP